MKNYKLLIVILFVSALLRLWNLGSIPPHLTPDEASLGYNAYSILKTGRDEYGTILPIIFKSFGDYKPGLYVYLTVPFAAIFGLNEWAIRLPSAIAGILSVYLIYLIVQELFRDKKLALVSAFVASITPWLIYFSRGAWEVNVSLTLTLAGTYFFLKSFSRSWFIVLSSLFFALTLITYQGAKLSTGIVVVLLVLVYFKELFSKVLKKDIIISVIVGLIVASPIIFSIFQGKTGRLSVFSVFSYPRQRGSLQNFLNEGNEKVGSLTYYAFHSESLNFARGIFGRWFNHFSGRFLFFEGDWANPRHSAPYQGMLLLSDIVILLYGLVVVLRNKLKKEHLFVLLWLVLAPLPAVLSRDQVHAIRSFNMTIPLVIILSFGLTAIFESKVKILKFVFFGFYLASFVYFLDAYFVHLPAHNSQYWDYGYKQIVEAVTPIQGNFKMIRVQQSYAQPYIFFLFFQKYDPTKYQKQAKLIPSEIPTDVGKIEHLDNIYFGPIDWSVNRGDKDTLFVADTIRIPTEDSSDPKLFKIIKEIKYLNGIYTAFRIIQVK